MPATWNAGFGSEIYAETPVASGIIPNQTTKFSWLAPKTETVDTGSNFKVGSNTLGFAKYFRRWDDWGFHLRFVILGLKDFLGGAPTSRISFIRLLVQGLGQLIQF